MYKFFKNLSCLLCLIVIFGGCRKKALDEYYGRPASLAPPIYQVLQARGNFTTLLSVIDRAGYKASLSTGGFWTFFAPNDAAFQKYFTANSTSLDKIDTVTAGKIVRYCLVYNAFQTTHLADYQSPTGYVPNLAFKRRTTYYDGFNTGTLPAPAGPNSIYVSENRNPGTNSGVGYVFGDNNNKYISYFYSTFMAQANLTAIDYNYFFPNSTYSGFNVVNASVVNKDILAENGVIHEIDQVVLPLPTIEQQLASNSQYSAFRNLYELYLVAATPDANFTRQYNNVTNKTAPVYVKSYNAALAFALGNESWIKLEADDSQKGGYTLFAPTNTVVNNYVGGVGVAGSLLEFYGSLTSLPTNILADFMNAHMFSTTVWPSKFASATNNSGEPARFDPGLPTGTSATSNIVQSQYCSNGLFYGVNQVQKANVFSTVYARVYLDPAYSIMLKLLNGSVKTQITTPSSRFTIFLMSDATLLAAGYSFDSATNLYAYTANGVTSENAGNAATLSRIVQSCIIPTPNNELNDLSGDGVAEGNSPGGSGGEYIRWHANTIVTAGLVEEGKSITVTGSRDYSNGRIYYTTGGLLDIPTKSIAGEILANTGTATAPGPYFDFYNYLINSASYNPGGGPLGTGEILGVALGTHYTVLIPTRAAMQQAVLNGDLPGTYTTGPTGIKTFVSFNYKPTVFSDKALVSNFILYHVIDGTTIVPDGKKPAPGTANNNFPTLLKDPKIADPIAAKQTLVIFNTAGATPGTGTLVVRDSKSVSANVIPQIANPLTLPGQTSNYLANYAVVHQIDNYLRYTLLP